VSMPVNDVHIDAQRGHEMTTAARRLVAAVLLMVGAGAAPAVAQTPAPATEAKQEEEKPKTFWEVAETLCPGPSASTR